MTTIHFEAFCRKCGKAYDYQVSSGHESYEDIACGDKKTFADWCCNCDEEATFDICDALAFRTSCEIAERKLKNGKKSR